MEKEPRKRLFFCGPKNDSEENSIMILRATAAFALLVGGQLPASHAADNPVYPQRPIRLVAPIAPGGGVDAMARTFGPELAQPPQLAVVFPDKGRL